MLYKYLVCDSIKYIFHLIEFMLVIPEKVEES